MFPLKYSPEEHVQIHCLTIVWNHPVSAPTLLCLEGAIFFKHLATPNSKCIENMFVHMNIFYMCLKIRVPLFFFEKNGTQVTPLVTTEGKNLFNLEKRANREICIILSTDVYL